MLFDKDNVCKLVNQTLGAVSRSSNETAVVNRELFDWFQGSPKDPAFNKLFDLVDAGHPEIGSLLSPNLTQKLFAEGAETEVLSSMMLSAVKPRLIKNPEIRDRARKVKSVCKVGMRSIYVLGENGYYGSPGDLLSFLRHSAYEKVDYDKFADLGKDFLKFDLTELHAVTQRIVSRMKELDQTDLWLGFHRVKPELAASTLARIHGFEWSDIFNLNCAVNRLPEFLVKSEVADKIVAEEVPTGNSNFIKSTAIRDRAKRDFKFVNLTYAPRMYPVHEFEYVPSNVSKILAAVEKIPELGNRPGFDYLWVLVPGFSMKHPGISQPDGMFRIMLEGKMFETKSETEIAAKFDKQLVQDQVLMPCLMGEREGKCYFIAPFI